jgi:hypothetical protein
MSTYLPNIAEERRSQVHCGRRLNSRMNVAQHLLSVSTVNVQDFFFNVLLTVHRDISIGYEPT